MSHFKHKVLIYSGGNFSGCIFEWNWCLWDKDGNWYKGYETGQDGIKFERLARDVARDVNKISAGKISHSHFSQINFETSLLDYTKNRDCKEIIEYNPGIVASILKYLNEELQEEHKISIKCKLCEMESPDLDDFQMDDVHHQGMASWYESFVCNDCKSEFSCTHCGEDYRGSENALITSDENRSPICEYCYQMEIDRKISMLGLLVKANKISEAIECRKEAEKMMEILDRHNNEDEDGEPVLEAEPVEDLLKNDTTPFLPWLFEAVS